MREWMTRFVVAWLALALGCAAFSFLTSCHPLASKSYSYDPADPNVLGCDFELRMNEIECIRSGIDPYLVWHGDVEHAKYYPFQQYEKMTSERNAPINAYAPWEYTYMLPIELLGHEAGWWLFIALQFVALLFVATSAMSVGLSHNGQFLWGGGLFLAAVLSPALPIWASVRSGNFAIIITALALVLFRLLKKDREIAAGVVYALMMTKPQLCLLFVVPLLFLRKFKTLAVAALVCVVATIPPCLMTGRSPITMILEAPMASAHAFIGCMLFPSSLVDWLGRIGCPATVPMMIAMVVGFSLCVFFTWRLLKSGQLHWIFAPAVFFSVAWTYNQWHSYCLYSLLAFPLCEIFLADARKGVGVLLLATLFCAMQGGFYVAKALELALPRIGVAFPLQAILGTRGLFEVVAVAGMCIIFCMKAKRHE